MNAKASLAIAILFAIINAFADDTAHIVVSARDNWTRNLEYREVTLTPVAPLPRTISTNLFSREVRRLTVTNGICVFSNTVWGYYKLDIQSWPSTTTFNLLLGTNHSGLVSAAALVTNSAALPPDPSTNYYTMSQVDALLAGLGGGGGGSGSNSVWLMSGTNISITSVTNLGTVTFTIYGDVSHQEVSNSTNGLATALIARMTDATNDLGTVLITRIANATNDIYGVLVTRITDATNILNTSLATKITNATNDLATALIARITASTNSGNIAFVTGAAKTLGAYDASATTNLNATELRSGTVSDARLSGNVSLLGSSITESELGLSDLTTANASTSAHGFLKKLSGTSSEYLDGSGNFSTPAGGSGWPTLNGRGTNPIVGGRAFGVQITNSANDELKFLSEQTGSTIATLNGGGVTASTFIGSGAALISLPADQLSSGQVPNGRLTQSNSYNGSFTGEASGLTNIVFYPKTVATLPSPAANTYPRYFCTDVVTSSGIGDPVTWNGTAWKTTEGVTATADIKTFILSATGLNVSSAKSRILLAQNNSLLNGVATLFGALGRQVGSSGAGQTTTAGFSNYGMVMNLNTGTTIGFGGTWYWGTYETSTGPASGDFLGCGGVYSVSALATAAEQYYVWVGFDSQANVGVYPTAGAGFLYDGFNTNAVVSNATFSATWTNNWLCVSGNNNMTTNVADSGLPVDITSSPSNRLFVVVTSTNVMFFTNGVQCAQLTNTVQIPAGNLYSSKIIFRKTLGTTSRSFYEAMPMLHIRKGTAKTLP